MNESFPGQSDGAGVVTAGHGRSRGTGRLQPCRLAPGAGDASRSTISRWWPMASLRRQTLARLRDTGIRVLDVEILRLKPETVVADFEKILAVGCRIRCQ